MTACTTDAYVLYWTRHSGALGPQIVLEEGGIPHEISPIDFRSGENKKPEYLAINPMGYVPALRCPDGSIVYETAAIMLHLAETHDLTELAPGVGDKDRPLFLRTLFFMSCTIQYLYHIFYNAPRYAPDEGTAPGIKEVARQHIFDRWAHVDSQLAAAGPYCLGDRFSMLDIYALMMATWYDPRDALLGNYPALARCFEETAQRPVVSRLLEEHGIA